MSLRPSSEGATAFETVKYLIQQSNLNLHPQILRKSQIFVDNLSFKLSLPFDFRI
jgi:hypothetical protein